MSDTTRRDALKSAVLTGLAGLAGCKPVDKPSPSAAPSGAEKKQGHWDAPPKQKSNDLNLIVLASDTFRADNLEAYGSQWVQTPYPDQFAKEYVIFENFYPEGLPTIPLRRQLYTGRRIFPTHFYFQQDSITIPGWDEHFVEDVTLAGTLLAAGYSTHLSRTCLIYLSRGAISIADLPTTNGFGGRRWTSTHRHRAADMILVASIRMTT